MTTSFARRLAMTYPIVQAPMAGGGDTPDLVAAVCNAGGIGFFGAGYSAPERIIEIARAVRARTARPFGVNLFAPQPDAPASAGMAAALDRVAPYYRELGIGVPQTIAAPVHGFEQQLEAVLRTDAAAFSFTFGLLPEDAMHTLKARMVVMGTATTVAEAVLLEQAGADAVIAQGAEAGGHRGTFAGPIEHGLIGTMALVPQIASAVGIPVVASGGIMDGRGIAAALALGAEAVQLGTAFLVCDEAGVPDAYKAAVLAAHEDGTDITRAFSGRPARGIVNRFLREMANAGTDVLPFPLQNAVTRPLRDAAARAGRAEFLSLWAGQGVRLARREKAADLVARLAAETEQTIARLARGPADDS